MEILTILIAGAVGALVSDILQDNCLIMPEIKSGKIYLGFFGGLVIGAIAGYLIDGSAVTAFMGGFTGKAIVIALLKKFELTSQGNEFPSNDTQQIK
jgi:hypothetical protein